MSAPGHSLAVLGPSGAGKSHLLRSALEEEGGGVAFLAPGRDEWESYADLEGDERFAVRGFDDEGFLPSGGRWAATGQRELVTALGQLYAAQVKELKDTGALKYPVLVLDAYTGADELCVNAGLAAAHESAMPKAISDKGGIVYGTIKVKHAEIMRGLRAVRNIGTHLLVSCHIVVKENEIGSAEGIGKEVHMPAITGSFRDQFFRPWNAVFHAGVQRDPALPFDHYVQWQSTSKRAAKSRYTRPISAEKRLPNEWSVLRPLLDEARGGTSDE